MEPTHVFEVSKGFSIYVMRDEIPNKWNFRVVNTELGVSVQSEYPCSNVEACLQQGVEEAVSMLSKHLDMDVRMTYNIIEFWAVFYNLRNDVRELDIMMKVSGDRKADYLFVLRILEALHERKKFYGFAPDRKRLDT